MELNEYETVEQYAHKKGISVQAVYQAINRGNIPVKMIGKVKLIPVGK